VRDAERLREEMQRIARDGVAIPIPPGAVVGTITPKGIDDEETA